MKFHTILILLLVPSGAFQIRRQPPKKVKPVAPPPPSAGVSGPPTRKGSDEGGLLQRVIIRPVQSAAHSFNNLLSWLPLFGTNTTETLHNATSGRQKSGIKKSKVLRANRGDDDSAKRRGLFQRISQTYREIAESFNVWEWISSSSNQTVALVDDFVGKNLPKVAVVLAGSGDRRALPAHNTDLSGKWKPIVTSEFRREYNEYLSHCGEPLIKRNLYSNMVALTRECIVQDGARLEITGTSPIGSWKRTLIASEANNPILTSFPDPDNHVVAVEAWWQQQGTVHESWLRNKPSVKGGEFETKRYLESDNVLICESWFHPNQNDTSGRFQPGYVKWRFERES